MSMRESTFGGRPYEHFLRDRLARQRGALRTQRGVRLWRLGVQNSGLTVQGSGLMVQSSEFNVQCSRFRIQGSGFRVEGSRYKVQVTGCATRTQHLGFRSWDFMRWFFFLGAEDLTRHESNSEDFSRMRAAAHTLLPPSWRQLSGKSMVC